MGLENPSHRKSFHPHDLGDCIIHYDFSQLKNVPFTSVAGKINDNLASSGALSNDQIRLKSSNYLSTSTCPDAGIVKINDEYFAFSGYVNSGSDVTTLTNVTRAQGGSSAEAHSAADTINIIAGQYAILDGGTGGAGSGDGLRDFTNWATTEMRISNLGSAGGYATLPDAAANRPGLFVADLATASRRALGFDGGNDRLPLDAAVVTASGDFSFVCIFRAEGGPSSDAFLGGSSGGINQMKLNANTLLFRFNGTNGSAPNAFHQIRANNTIAYSVGSRGAVSDKGASGNSYLTNQNELLIFIKEKNATDNQEKVHVYDVANLVSEDLLNGSGSGGQSGYPDNEENPSDTEFQISHIGALSNDAGDFAGEMAEVLIFDKALTAANVVLLQEYYNNLYPSLTSG